MPSVHKKAFDIYDSLPTDADVTVEEIKQDIENRLMYVDSLDQAVKEVEGQYLSMKLESGSMDEIDVHIPEDLSSSDYDPEMHPTDANKTGAGRESSDYTSQLQNEYPKNWDSLRQQAYKRDDYQCQNCHVRGGPNGDVELHAHHIVPISSGGNNVLSNLATLCRECHGLIHEQVD